MTGTLAVAVMAGMLQLAATPPEADAATLVHDIEAESLATSGYTSKDDTSATFYANGDSATGTIDFAEAGRYTLTARGASSSDSAAGISVYVGDTKAASLTFNGSSFTDASEVFDLAQAGETDLRLELETDTGANDTLVDDLRFEYEGPTPEAPPAPTPSSEGAVETGEYRNLFQEWDSSLTDADISAKVDEYWTSFFESTDDTERLYYPAGSNANGPQAYIKDTGNDDVRSEGVSYGMMIAVQLNKKAEFDALWNWAKTNMQHKSGAREGYFCWQANFAGSCVDNNPASDGEEYFATALMFAGNRWGDGEGIYDYTTEGNEILNTMLHKEDMNDGVVDSVTNMFDRENKMITFVPFATAAEFSDPSYHLPAFYELWGRWATGYEGNQAADRQFWLDAAERSRDYFVEATHPETGLNPDYAEFDGTPNRTGNHGDFRFDAWRTSVNWAVDYAWWADDPNEKVLTDRLQSFFESEGMTGYANQYSLDGKALSTEQSPGLIASNGAASLAATDQRAWKFVEQLWELEPSTGKYRYYDGLLNFMALLHASGNFQAYGPTSDVPDPDPETPVEGVPAAPSSLTATVGSETSVELSWADNSSNETGFSIERKTGADGTWAPIADVEPNIEAFTDADVVTGTQYSYRVRATGADGDSAYTAVAEATPEAESGREGHDPARAIEAESFDDGSDVAIEAGDAGPVVAFAGSGSYIKLADVDFGTTEVTSVQLRAKKPSNGGNVQISVGSPTSGSNCTIYPDGNSTWHLKSNTCYPKFSGTQDVFIKATGPLAIDSITFLPHAG